MQVIKVISSVSSSEHINLIFVAIRSVHIARPGRHSCKLVVQPLKLLQIEDMHIISSEWPLAKPPSNDVEPVFYKNLFILKKDLLTKVAVWPFLP